MSRSEEPTTSRAAAPAAAPRPNRLARLGQVTQKVFLGLLIVTAVGCFCLGRFVAAEAPPPGSEEDPLVTRSYVDQYTVWRIVELQPGQTMVAEAGSEIVVRAGSATVVASSRGGLVDLTGGQDLSGGTAVPLNHLLLVPRSDERGIRGVSSTVLMVRGAYTIR